MTETATIRNGHAASSRRRPRIALLASYPPDHTTFAGGIASATAALLEGLQAYQDEFELHLISTVKGLPTDVHEERQGIRFHFLRVPRQRWLRPRMAFGVVRTWLELLRLKPDLVHVQSSSAGALAAIFGGYPRLNTVHGVVRDEVRLRTGWEFWAACFQVPLESFTYRHFDHVVCISRYAQARVGPRAHTYLIPNAVDPRFLSARRSAADLPASPYLLFVGVVAPLKRPGDLLAAHARLRHEFPTLRTLVCGHTEDAAYERGLRLMLAEQQSDGVYFLGHTNRERLTELLTGAAALVLPSAQENTPMVIAEAMAAGVPVVATSVGGVPDMLRDGHTGLLYQPGDVDALTEALRRLLDDPSLRERLASEGRRWASQAYSPPRVAEQNVAVYRHMLGLQPMTVSAS